MRVLGPPGALDGKRDEEIRSKGVDHRLGRPADRFAEPQRPLARRLDTRTHALVEDRTPERSLGRLEVEPKRMLAARHGGVSLRLHEQVRDHVSIHRRLRLDPESFRNPRRKRVRSQTLPLLPLAFPACSVV